MACVADQHSISVTVVISAIFALRAWPFMLLSGWLFLICFLKCARLLLVQMQVGSTPTVSESIGEPRSDRCQGVQQRTRASSFASLEDGTVHSRFPLPPHHPHDGKNI